LLDFDRDAVAIDQHHAARDRQIAARTLTSSASVASSSMMAPRDSRIAWWIGIVEVPSTTIRSTVTLSRVATSEPPDCD